MAARILRDICRLIYLKKKEFLNFISFCVIYLDIFIFAERELFVRIGKINSLLAYENPFNEWLFEMSLIMK